MSFMTTCRKFFLGGNKRVVAALIMKIEIITDTYRPDVNGVAMTLGRLTDGLRNRGHLVHVVHTAAEAADGESLARSIALPGYPDVRVGLPKPFNFRQRWERKRPDVIYVATESPLGKSALKAAQFHGIPSITGFHTNFHQYLERYGMPGMESLAKSYLRKFHNRAQCTMTPSPGMVGELEQIGIKNVELLGRGVDTELFAPSRRCETLRSEWGVDSNTPVAVIVGRVAAEKNLELGMKAFERMRDVIPGMACVVVGDGPIRKSLQYSRPWLNFVGMRTGVDLARHYASSDILIFPSETETFGNVLLEGMASGLVSVSFDYAAAAMHVEQGSNGLKAPFGNAETFLQQAVHALAFPHGHALRIQARRTAEQQGWDRVLDKFEKVLGDLARKSAHLNPQRLRRLSRPKLECRSVILSDIHLGSPDSKADEVVQFLKHIKCEKLILNGDIIDGWALKRGGKWTSRHSRLIRKFIKLSERDRSEIFYIRGNHDEILDRFLPISLGRIQLVKQHIHKGINGKRYLVVHGDGFDSVSTNHRWLAALGAVGYDTLLMINRHYNKWRRWHGKEYYSISKRVKAKVKSAVSFLDRYEQLLQNLARQNHCDGIICGHIHTPEDKQVGDVHYLNSGDWVESLTAIIEHYDGRMELVEYTDFMRRLYLKQDTPAAQHEYKDHEDDILVA